MRCCHQAAIASEPPKILVAGGGDGDGGGRGDDDGEDDRDEFKSPDDDDEDDEDYEDEVDDVVRSILEIPGVGYLHMEHDPQEKPVDIIEAAAGASVWLASLVGFEYDFVHGGAGHRAVWPQYAPITELPLVGDMVFLHGIQTATATAVAPAAVPWQQFEDTMNALHGARDKTCEAHKLALGIDEATSLEQAKSYAVGIEKLLWPVWNSHDEEANNGSSSSSCCCGSRRSDSNGRQRQQQLQRQRRLPQGFLPPPSLLGRGRGGASTYRGIHSSSMIAEAAAEAATAAERQQQRQMQQKQAGMQIFVKTPTMARPPPWT